MFTILDVLPHIEDFINEQVLFLITIIFTFFTTCCKLTINTSTIVSIADHQHNDVVQWCHQHMMMMNVIIHKKLSDLFSQMDEM